MTRAQKRQQNERFRMKYERMFIGPVNDALQTQISSFTSDLNSHGLSYAQSRLSESIVNESIGVVLDKLYVTAGTAKANQVYSQLIKEPNKKGFGFNAEWTNQIKDYLRMHLFKTVAKITHTTRQLINNKIQQMVQEGQSIEWLAQNVKTDRFTAWRARMIARTESNRAINYGAQLGAEKTGFETMKEWVSVHDPRTRHSHYVLDGKKVGLNESFKEGLSFPGDPDGDPEETINCRCHLEYTAKRNAQGYLVPADGRPIQRVRNRQRLRNILELVQSN